MLLQVDAAVVGAGVLRELLVVAQRPVSQDLREPCPGCLFVGAVLRYQQIAGCFRFVCLFVGVPGGEEFEHARHHPLDNDPRGGARANRGSQESGDGVNGSQERQLIRFSPVRVHIFLTPRIGRRG